MGVVIRGMFLTLALALGPASPASAQRAYDIRMLLASSDDFASRVSIKSDHVAREAIHEVELCQTNVCDMFELRGEENLDNLTTVLDFALIYTVYASLYAKFGGPSIVDSETGNQGRRPIDFVIKEYERGPELLDIYGDNCRIRSEAERAICVIKDLIEEHDIAFYSVRYDQGFRVATPNNVLLDRLSIERTETYLRRVRQIRNYEIVR